jgi:signal transduction histidine kinase
LSSIKNRLVLLFFAITLAAMAFVYVYVAPSLGSSLRKDHLDSLAIAANGFTHHPVEHAEHRQPMSSEELIGYVDDAAAISSDRVTVIAIKWVGSGARATPTATYLADSSAASPEAMNVSHVNFLHLAREAAREGRLLTGSVDSADGPVGEAAKPIKEPGGRVIEAVVFSSSLSDVDHSVALIRGRILLAGSIALVLSLLAVYLVARALSLRVGRLESSARRVAAGDFSASFSVDSRDELGKLAGTLDSMRRQLAELDSARERFIATASHELRTPIFSLGGFIELIQDEDLDEETRAQFFTQIREQVERLGKLTTRLLDLSRLESGGLELHPSRADLGEIVEAVSAEFIPALAAHSSELRRLEGEEPAIALCDPERVAQILRVLIDNAIKHTPKGTPISVSVSSSGGRARLAVEDSGLGLDPGAVERVFEPFYTSGAIQGSGLGLAIAHELAERMGGSLEVESSPGRTVFTLALLAAEVKEAELAHRPG